MSATQASDQDQTQAQEQADPVLAAIMVRGLNKSMNEATREQIALRILADLYAAGPTRILQLRHEGTKASTPSASSPRHEGDVYVIVCCGDEHLPFIGEVRRQIGMKNEAPPLPDGFHDNDPDGLG